MVKTEVVPHWRCKPTLAWSEDGFCRRGSRNPLPWPNGSGAGVMGPFPRLNGSVAKEVGNGLFRLPAARKATLGQLCVKFAANPTTPAQLSKNLPYPARKTVLSLIRYATPTRGWKLS